MSEQFYPTSPRSVYSYYSDNDSVGTPSPRPKIKNTNPKTIKITKEIIDIFGPHIGMFPEEKYNLAEGSEIDFDEFLDMLGNIMDKYFQTKISRC